ADEHGGENPGNGDLGDVLVPPGSEVGAGAVAAQSGGVLVPPLLAEFPAGGEDGAQVVLDLEREATGIGGQRGRVDHGASSRRGEGSSATDRASVSLQA